LARLSAPLTPIFCNLDEIADFLLDSFASDKLVMLILDKVLLLLDNPFKGKVRKG
jgi:hypothetical protein